ncbi:MAG: M48 family metallopeptidase [Akkermansiaceae bacterium]|nr:M48 family metallopeptidase [Akkermansiaceae bacterium]
MINHLIPANSVILTKPIADRDLITLSQSLSFVDNLVYGRVLLRQKLANLVLGLGENIQAQYDEVGNLVNRTFENSLLTVHETLYGLLLLTGHEEAVPPRFRTPRYKVTEDFIATQLSNGILTSAELYTIWGMLRFVAGEYGPTWQKELRSQLSIDEQFDSVISAVLVQKASNWTYRVENDREAVLTLEAYVTILRAVVTAVRPILNRRVKLNGLSAASFQNDIDRALAQNLLSKFNVLGFLTGKVVDTFVRWQVINIKSGGICVNEHSQPALYQVVKNVCEVLCMEIPDVYIYDTAGGGINAYTTGIEKPIIVLSRMAASVLDEHELAYIIGHECGHIICNHVKYHIIMDILSSNLFPGGELAQVLALGPLLSAWHRRSELSADRAGLLACQNMEAVKRAMLKMMGSPFAEYQRLRTSTLVGQAMDFQNLMDEKALDRTFNLLQSATLTHPRMVFRCTELLNWLKTGDYQLLLNATAEERAAIASRNALPETTRAQNDVIARKLAEWASAYSKRPFQELLSGARTLLLSQSSTAMAPFNTIFSIHTETAQDSQDRNTYICSLIIRFVDAAGPKEYSTEIMSLSWLELPSEAQEHFMRNGSDVSYQNDIYRYSAN